MTTALSTLLAPTLPISSLDGYIARVNQIPLLTATEEQELAQRFYQHNDLTAARQLVLAHLRFVVKVARNYAGYGLAQADLIQEGNIGLMKAVKRFDPTVGVRLVTFAFHWIKAEIHEFILRNWRIVKVATTKAQRKLFFNLRQTAANWRCLTQQETAMIAEDLCVKPEAVAEMAQRMSGQEIDIEPSGYEEENAGMKRPASLNYLADERYAPERWLERQDEAGFGQHHVLAALQQLDLRSQAIIQQRWLNAEKATLQALAAHYGISIERVRQLEQAALKKLKEAIHEIA